MIVLAAVESQPPPEKNPALGRNPHFCYCRIEPFGDFFGNDTTRTPDPIRPTRRSPDPNRRTATKGILSGGGGTPLAASADLLKHLCGQSNYSSD